MMAHTTSHNTRQHDAVAARANTLNGTPSQEIVYPESGVPMRVAATRYAPLQLVINKPSSGEVCLIK